MVSSSWWDLFYKPFKQLFIMSIFSGLRTYAGKWNVTSIKNFEQEDIELVRTASVVPSQYGLSVCFLMKNGNMHFIPCEQNTSANAGDVVDLATAKVITLAKEGEEDIQRIRI